MRSFLFLVTLAACAGSPRPVPASPSNSPAPPSSAPAAENLCTNHPDPMGPWMLTAAQMPLRLGTGVTQLAALPTTKEHAIEVCGVAAENAWLAAATCADGSHPYAGPDTVEQSRTGSVGEGGRCGGIIDLYAVKCPEKTYDVFIDMNLCGPGESFM